MEKLKTFLYLWKRFSKLCLNAESKIQKKHGKSREMKIGIAYDGVLHQVQKDGKIHKKLHNKVTYASFESADKFRKHKENVIASVYNTDEIALRVKNGDDANWIQKDNSKPFTDLSF